VLNAVMLLVVAHATPTLAVDNVLTIVTSAFVLSLLSAVLNALVGPVLRHAFS